MQTKQDVARDGKMMMLKLIRVIEFLHNGGLMSKAFQKLEVEVAGGLQCSLTVYLKVVSSMMLH